MTTIGRFAPATGLRRDHTSTLRVFPASLCAPTKFRAVPLYVTPVTAAPFEFVRLMDTPTSRRRFAVAVVVWLKLTVPVPVPVIRAVPDVEASTKTWAAAWVEPINKRRSPRAHTRLGGASRAAFDETLRWLHVIRATLPSLLRRTSALAAHCSARPPIPLSFARTILRPTCTSLASATPRISSPRTAGSSCSPQSPRVTNTFFSHSTITSLWTRKPLSLLVKTISPFRNLLTITGVTWTISPSRILGDMLPPRASKRTHTPAFSSSRLRASNISE